MESSTLRPGHPGTVDRRIRKTQRAIRDAFVALVLERGFDGVTIEDITERADLARATFYKHFADKEELLTTLFEELTTELTVRITTVEGAPETVRTSMLRALYEHAEQFRDLYLVCLRGAGNGRARAAYVQVITEGAERTFQARLDATGDESQHPLPVIARLYAGAHVALLENWLEQETRDVESIVMTETELLSYGLVWALRMLPDEISAAFPRIEAFQDQ